MHQRRFILFASRVFTPCIACEVQKRASEFCSILLAVAAACEKIREGLYNGFTSVFTVVLLLLYG
jgi:hypothetical protein